MLTIHKFHLPDIIWGCGTYYINIPRKANILSVQMQGDQPKMWALVDTESPRENRKIFIAATGQEIPADCPNGFIGTWQDRGFVFHLFA